MTNFLDNFNGCFAVTASRGIMAGLHLKSAIITGANRGIGLEMVRQLAALPQPPKHIFATCRNPNAAKVQDILF